MPTTGPTTNDPTGSPGLRRLPRRARRLLGALAAALALVLAVTSGVALAGGTNDRLAVSAASSGDPTARDKDGAPREHRMREHRMRGMPGRGHSVAPGLGRGPLAGALHGEYVEADPAGGYRTVVAQRGKVTSVSGTSLTVRSKDGFVTTYRLTGDTGVLGGTAGLGDVEEGDDVGVRGVRDGSSTDATHVLDLSRLLDLRQDRRDSRDQRDQRDQQST